MRNPCAARPFTSVRKCRASPDAPPPPPHLPRPPPPPTSLPPPPAPTPPPASNAAPLRTHERYKAPKPSKLEKVLVALPLQLEIVPAVCGSGDGFGLACGVLLSFKRRTLSPLFVHGISLVGD